MSEDEIPGFEGEEPEIEPAEILMMEYQEAGEEWRTHASLLTKGYYLAGVLFTFFAGSMATLYIQGNLLIAGLLGLVGGVVFVLLSASTNAYHERRNAASELRTRVSKEIHHFGELESPRIQRDVVGRDPIEDDRDYRRSGKGTLEKLFTVVPPLYWLILGAGSLMFLGGVGLLMTGLSS